MSRRGRPGDPAGAVGSSRWTVLGAVGAPGAMAVDTAGRIVTGRVGWSLDWEILAGQRRLVPGTEATLRQCGGAGGGTIPVGLETSMRLDDGAVTQTVYVCLPPTPRGGAVGVVEVRNESAAPVAARLILLPDDFWRSGGLRTVQTGAAGVRVNGSPALWWDRPPSDVQVAADISDAIGASGAASTPTAGPVRSRRGRAGARLTWPVTHGTTLRVLLPLPPAADEAPAPASVPALGQVSRGWEAHTSPGLRVDGPAGGRLGTATAAAVRRLLALDIEVGSRRGIDGLLSPAERALVAVALAVAGFPRPAAEIVPARTAGNPGSLARLARREAARRIEPWGRGAVALGAMVAGAGVGGGWRSDRSGEDPLSRAAFLLGLRDALVAEGDGRLDIRGGDDAIIGTAGPRPPVEVHGLGTGWGTLSFAVRWHGAVPALLWELTPPRTRLESWAAALAGGRVAPQVPPRITAGSLDATWSTLELAGEALLAT